MGCRKIVFCIVVHHLNLGDLGSMHSLKKKKESRLVKPDINIFSLKGKKIVFKVHPFTEKPTPENKKLPLHLDTINQIDQVISEYEKQTNSMEPEQILTEVKNLVEIRETHTRKTDFSFFQPQITTDNFFSEIKTNQGFVPCFEVVPDPVFVNKNDITEEIKQNFDQTILKVAEGKTKIKIETKQKTTSSPKINNIVKQEQKLQKTMQQLEEQKKQIKQAEKQTKEKEKQLKIREKQEAIKQKQREKQKQKEAKQRAIEEKKQAKLFAKQQKIEAKRKLQEEKKKQIDLKKQQIQEAKKQKQREREKQLRQKQEEKTLLEKQRLQAKEKKLKAKQELKQEKEQQKLEILRQKELETKQKEKQKNKKITQIQTKKETLNAEKLEKTQLEQAAKVALEKEKELALIQKQELKKQKKKEKQELTKLLTQEAETQKQKKGFFKKQEQKQPVFEQIKQKPVIHNLKMDKKETFFDEDVKKVLEITDELLGKLPDEVIDEFAQSKDFELYEKVINKLRNK